MLVIVFLPINPKNWKSCKCFTFGGPGASLLQANNMDATITLSVFGNF